MSNERRYRSNLSNAIASAQHGHLQWRRRGSFSSRAAACAKYKIARSIDAQHQNPALVTGSRHQMQEDTRTRVLRLIADNPQMTQRELADAVGISTGSVHYLLNALLEAGLVKFGNFSASQDKRRYAYILTPRGVAEKAALTRRFLGRKLQEYEALRREIDALEEEMSQEGSASGQALSGTPTRNR